MYPYGAVMAMGRSELVDPGSDGVEHEKASELRLGLLKGFELYRDGFLVSLPLSAQRLIAFLALRDRSLLRIHVATMLWPDLREERSVANLRTALWRIRSEECFVVEQTGTHLRLDRSVIVDYRLSTARAQQLLDTSGQIDVENLDEGYFAEDLLPDWYDEWAVVERERFRQLRMCALESTAERLVAAGRSGRATQAALIAVCEEPLRESAQRVLVRAHLARGNRGEAIKQYQRYRRALYEELHVTPSPLFEELILGIGRAGSAGVGRQEGAGRAEAAG
jgi:DNA-binding SARP family transcriptional activator